MQRITRCDLVSSVFGVQKLHLVGLVLVFVLVPRDSLAGVPVPFVLSVQLILPVAMAEYS